MGTWLGVTWKSSLLGGAQERGIFERLLTTGESTLASRVVVPTGRGKMGKVQKKTSTEFAIVIQVKKPRGQ